jgi:ribosomal 50S subunit-associated protein YjgA (DUF615 family)
MSDKRWWTQEEVTRITDRIAELEAQNERQVREIRNLDKMHRDRIAELESAIRQFLMNHPEDIDSEPDYIFLLRDVMAEKNGG